MAEVVFWDFHIRVGSHHYGRLFLDDYNKVFFLSQYLHPFSLIKGKKVAYDMFWSWKDGVTKPEKNLLTYTPLSLIPYINYPFFASKRVAIHNIKLTSPYLPKLLKNYGFGKVDVLWITNPKYISITNFIEYRLLVYRKADDDKEFSAHPYSLKHLGEELLKKSDIVFATAKNLLEESKKLNRNSYYLPNGVNFEHFYDTKDDEPEDISSFAKPRILYVGAIEDWFDFDLLLKTAKKLKDYSFILIGPSNLNLSVLKKIPNLFILGPRNYCDLPAYMKYCDVGIIPFKKNKLCHSVNPIKLYEYFASGLPVVSTNLQEVANISSPAIIAKDEVDFAERLTQAIGDGKNKKEYFQFARNNSWQKRYDFVKEIISNNFNISL